MPVAGSEQEKQEERLNPSAQHSQKLFDEPFMPPGDSEREEVVRRLAERDRLAAESEKPEAGIEGVKNGENNPNALNKLLPGSNLFNPSGNLANKAIKRWGVGIIISTIVAVITALGTGIIGFFVNLKEMTLNFFTQNEYSSYSVRVKSLQDRIFKVPGQGCKLSIRCRLAPGLTDKEIKRYKDAGFEVETGETPDGKAYMKKLSTEVDGKVFEINEKNFKDIYGGASLESLIIRGRLWATGSKPNALVWRAANALLKFAQFKIDRSFVGNKLEDIRRYVFGGGKTGSKVAGPESDNGDQTQNDQVTKDITDVNQSIADAAATQDANVAQGNAPGGDQVLDPGALNGDPAAAATVAEQAAASSVGDAARGAIEGVASAITYACTGYSILREVTLGAKIFKYAGLILFAISFMTQADALKAQKATPANISLYAGSLVRPSTLPGSLGKTAANSNLFSLVTAGKVTSVTGLAFGVMGFPALGFLEGAMKFFEGLGANKNNCKQVLSWYGQAILGITGIVTAIFSVGGTSVGGIVISVGLGLVLSSVISFVTPMLIKYVAGTVAPDLLGPGGGFAIGEAIAGGVGGFAAELGKVGGDRPLNTTEAQQVFKETSQQMAQMNTIEQMGKSPFSFDSPNSITSRLAMALFPYVSAPTSQPNIQSLASLATTPFTLVGDAVNQLFTQRVGALSTSFGGEYCADPDLISMNVVTDAYCNPVEGEQQAVLDAPKYTPEKVMDYMINNQYVNEADATATTTANGQQYTKFLNSCVLGAYPLTPDGGPIDITSSDDIDTRLCLKQDEQETMFRLFVMDQNIMDGLDASANGTLGQNNQQGGTPSPTQGPQNPGGFVWPVQPSSKSVISGCMNETDPSYRIHDGLDIAAPEGTDIVSVADGTVILETKNEPLGFGYYIAIKHTNGTVTGYGHNLANLVKEGDVVKQGQVIAKVGNRGNSTGPHLHLNYIPSGSSPWTNGGALAYNPLYHNVLPKPADVPDQAGCMTPQKLKPR